MFDWFAERGLWLLQEYCKNYEKMTYSITESGIDVTIITKEILLLTDLDIELLNLLQLSAACHIKSANKKLKIFLWFRGWKWQEKDDCFFGTAEVE